MMGVERGNPDLLILTLVGGAALIYEEQRIGRTLSAIALIGLAIVLKLFPVFSVGLAARFNRRRFLFACGIAAISLIYLVFIFKYVLLIRANVPTTWILSYGYKAAFLGWDQLRAEAGLDRTELADTYAPIIVSALTLLCAVAGALMSFQCCRTLCKVDDSLAGTAFLFGSGIYCGTFLLGTNFVYRLMFLLLCLPQLLDWESCRRTGSPIPTIEHTLLLTVISVLWLNGNANGHSTFLFLPQVIDWLLFFGLTWVIAANFRDSIFPVSASGPAAR
jgi:hypothetical protein